MFCDLVGSTALSAGRGGANLWSGQVILAYITEPVDQELLLRNIGCRKSDLEGSMAGASEALRCRANDARRGRLSTGGARPSAKRRPPPLPDIILKWYRRLVARKFDGSSPRRAAGRPPIGKQIEELLFPQVTETRCDKLVECRKRLGGSCVTITGRRVS
jgi:putative transposase